MITVSIRSVPFTSSSFALGRDGTATTAACASGELCKSSSRARGYFCVGDSDEVVLVRVRGRGRPAREAELREDVADVACNRLLAQDELLRDGSIAIPRCDE